MIADAELEILLKQISDEQQKIVEGLRKLPAGSEKKKDAWDKFSSVSTFLSGVLVALMGIIFTVTYNNRQKDEQNKIASTQTVAPFLMYLMADDELKLKRHHALQILGVLPDKDLARALTTEFPAGLNANLIQNLQDKRNPHAGEQDVRVKLTSPIAGSTILFDGFKNYKISGFNFAKTTIGPWGTGQPDIEVANPGGSSAVLFFEYDSPPYTDVDFPAGKTPANGGAIKMSGLELSEIKEAPESGYQPHYVQAEVGALYCIRTWDGHHFAKIKITDVEADRIGFEWVYQPSNTRRFE